MTASLVFSSTTPRNKIIIRPVARVTVHRPGCRNVWPKSKIETLKGRSSVARAGCNARSSFRVENVAEFTRAASAESVLCAKFAGHGAAVAAALVLEDSPDRKRILTTSLDKTVALWTTEVIVNASCSLCLERVPFFIDSVFDALPICCLSGRLRFSLQ